MTIEEMKRRRDVPVIEADQTGLVRWVNAAFEEVFGWSAAEIVGRPLTMLIPERLRDAHNLGFSRFVMGGKTSIIGQALRLRAIDKKGREFDAEHFIIAERRDARWVIAATMQPLDRLP